MYFYLWVVICLKSLTFVVSITTDETKWKEAHSCDLLEKSYLCGINNNRYVVKHCVLATYKVVVKINFDPQLKRGCVKMSTSSFLCTKPRLSQARALLFPKVFVPLGIQKFSL